jgi:hypothetical protein
MAFTFDLISDLHIDTWPQFDWTQKPTSAYCVVAGDVARDTKTVIDTLRHLGQCYQATMSMCISMRISATVIEN